MDVESACLYRMWDVAGDLLYVGISTSAMNRMHQHSNDKPWWRSVHSITITHVDAYLDVPAKKVAREIESWAIHVERPRHNRMRPHPKRQFEVLYRLEYVRIAGSNPDCEKCAEDRRLTSEWVEHTRQLLA